jgi:hypothetical protein
MTERTDPALPAVIGIPAPQFGRLKKGIEFMRDMAAEELGASPAVGPECALRHILRKAEDMLALLEGRPRL